MSDLTVTLLVKLPGVIDKIREETIHIPPAFAEQDIRNEVGHAAEGIGARLLRDEGFPTPLRTVMLGNAVRLSRLEELINEFFQDHSISSNVLDRLRELTLVDAPEAITRWGGHTIESDGDPDEPEG